MLKNDLTGTNYSAIKHKVPMLVFYDHFEQQINAVELERKGIALRLDRKQRTREDILASVEELLGNKRVKEHNKQANEYNEKLREEKANDSIKEAAEKNQLQSEHLPGSEELID